VGYVGVPVQARSSQLDGKKHRVFGEFSPLMLVPMGPEL
jgi:hypothetical protein